jgi:hypothetical protein
LTLPTTAVDHPCWCSPEHCQTSAAGEHRHRSTPLTWRLTSGEADVELCRVTVEGSPTAPAFEMTLRHLEYPGEVTVDLTRDDLVLFLGGWDHLNELI